MERFGPRPAAMAWWRLVAALIAAVLVLSLMAGRVANMLARPMEQLQHAAERFGSGDLAFRTELADAPRRWVASEVHGVAVAFNTMAARIEAMVRGQRELLGAISHELRSPLGRARIALEIARDRIADGEAPLPEGPSEARDPTQDTRRPRSPAPQLDTIEAQLVEVDAILGDLLEITRAGLADLRKENLDLAPWLAALVAKEPSPPAIELDTTDGANAHASIDSALLARAVHNLLENARVHGHPGDAPLVVRIALRAGKVTITVRDRGPGFAPDFLARAFEPFVRGDPSRARTGRAGGTGLGLALVRRIAEAHGGTAFARNADDTGAEVGIELPESPASH
jgi:signal transduction histidine kinase